MTHDFRLAAVQLTEIDECTFYFIFIDIVHRHPGHECTCLTVVGVSWLQKCSTSPDLAGHFQSSLQSPPCSLLLVPIKHTNQVYISSLDYHVASKLGFFSLTTKLELEKNKSTCSCKKINVLKLVRKNQILGSDSLDCEMTSLDIVANLFTAYVFAR